MIYLGTTVEMQFVEDTSGCMLKVLYDWQNAISKQRHRRTFERQQMWYLGFYQPSKVIATYGREVFERIPPEKFIKHGKRRYVPLSAIYQADADHLKRL